MSIQKLKEILFSPISPSKISKVLSGEIEPVSLKYLLDNLSLNIDKEIIEVAKSRGIKPIGGELFVFVNNDEKIEINWDFYFSNKNEDNQMIKISSQKIIEKEFLMAGDYNAIKKERQKYEINPPNID